MKLQELKAIGDKAWEAVKAGAKKGWAEAKSAYYNAARVQIWQGR